MNELMTKCCYCNTYLKEVPRNQEKAFQKISDDLDYLHVLHQSIPKDVFPLLNICVNTHLHFFTHYMCPHHVQLKLLFDIEGVSLKKELSFFWSNFQKEVLTIPKSDIPQIINTIKKIHKIIELLTKIQEQSVKLSTAMSLIPNSLNYIIFDQPKRS